MLLTSILNKTHDIWVISMNRRISKTKIHGYNKYYCPFASICDNGVKFDGKINAKNLLHKQKKVKGEFKFFP